MQVFYNPDHARHNPSKFINRGQAKANPEVPERGRIFLDAVTAGGHVVQNPPKFGLAPVRRVHDAGYLEYLETAWALWSVQADYAPEIIPNIHPGRNMATKPTDIIGLAGYYQTDTACPIGPATWDAARAAADSALAAADHVLAGRAGEAYALCRPPGHHAYHDMAGG
ncbi:MAG: histone deacetylase family protein, partial [Pseudomonadota bacterium]|nr:histone deacetylase family protein [Pseudomonadota bacterium]